MRILVAHNVPRARQGGMSRIMGFIHDRIAREGHDVEYVTSDDLPPRLAGAAARAAFPLLVARKALAAARRGRPFDIVNVHEPASAPSALLRRAGRIRRVVVTSHGLERRAWELALEEGRLGRGGPSRRARVFHPLTVLSQCRIGLAHADRVFVLNSEDRDFLARTTGRDPATIQRIWPGAGPEFSAASTPRDYGTCGSVLFAATWRQNKGIADLVPAMRRVWEARPELVLNVLGAGVTAAAVERAFGGAGPVRVLTAASDEEAARVYAASDLFVLPSLFEGTPLVLIEAMASGLPIVTTDTCGMKDVIKDGVTGILVPVRSPDRVSAALLALASDSGLRQRLGAAARTEAAERYTWDGAAKPVLEAYKLLL